MTKFEKDYLGAYFDHGIDMANRRVFLDSDISSESVGPAIKGLYLMETESSEKPIEMFISSFGGCIYECLALYDIMNTIRCPIHTFGYGKCFSAAPLLLAAGEPGHRWCSPHVFFMYHDWAAGIDGTSSQLSSYFKHYQLVGKQWTKLLAKHTSKDARWWDRLAQKPADYFFSADEAIEWGLADNIWVENE